MFKRIFDLTISAILLFIFSPVLLFVAILIKTGSRGPVFYRGVRVGLRGRPFRIFKFRSMVVDAEKIGGASSANGDPRITPIGSTIRKYKLDELPQLINVFVGDMSLVGPRPEVQQYTDLYTDEEKIILTVRPGITDWASIWNSDEGAILAGSSDPERTYLEEIRPGKLKLQMRYVKKQSMMTDLSILIRTAETVLLKKRVNSLAAIEEEC